MSGRKHLLLHSVSMTLATVLATSVLASQAMAQEAAPEKDLAIVDSNESESPPGDIVVTGTRVVRDGFSAPTPVSVIGAAELAAKAPANIADYLNTLPAVSGALTPRSTIGFTGNGTIGINALNLRNLGATRTLVLLDGQRVGASTVTGQVDINQFPQQLVKRIDIVTGGASSSWGSDAVAGVVNFVLDHDFTGVKAQLQGGVTDYGDDRNYNAQLSAGFKFADGRGHILLSGEISHSDGTNGIGKRKWYTGRKVLNNPTYTATNGQPQLLVRDNAGIATATPGGIILSGPLRGTYFGPGGTLGTFNFGSLVSGAVQVGGDWEYSDYGTRVNLAPETGRQNIFGRVSYELTDNIEIFAQAAYSRATALQDANYFTRLGNLTIQPDNAFIPASIASRITAPVTFGTLNADLPGLIAYNKRSSYRLVVGANGKFDALGKNWSWDVYALRNANRVYNSLETLITTPYNQAIDAVRNANGQIVCRSTLTNPTNGCVPLNLFGTGVVSDAAKNYVTGTSERTDKLTQDVIAATLRGEPFDTWAGPVSIATGIEHRRERVTGENDPLSAVRAFANGNYQATFGKYHVSEAFFETVVPLAKGAPFAEALDLNGAVRATDYSTSGYVTTWKVGLTYKPVSDITFRVTRSRDIRAPNLAELFQTGFFTSTSVVDPFRNNTTTPNVQTLSVGNPNLKPEKADTWGLGVVLQPSFLPGFGASIDYYNIKVEDAITTLSPAQIVNQCFAGNQSYCGNLTRTAAGILSGVRQDPINLSKLLARGIDFEASYRTTLFGGELNLRGLATRYLKNQQDNGINAPTDTVGKNAADPSVAGTVNAATLSLPKWRYTASISWSRDPIGLNFTARGFSSGVYDPSFIECTSACPASTTTNMTIDNNRIAGAIYYDANVRFKITDKIESFLVVDNILNTDPVQIGIGPAISAAPLSVNQSLYDTMGRVFRVGVRVGL
jgi:outer membrane receptor protein involved in Fe transport